MTDAPPPDFTGRLDDYLAWVAEHPMPTHPLFCARHWAPCPVDRKPGLLMTIVMQVELLGRMPADVGTDATALNSWTANRLTPLCCELGDAHMTWLWAELDAPHCNLAAPRGHRMHGGRVCWKRPGHFGPHEWEEPGSVFALMPSAGGDRG